MTTTISMSPNKLALLVAVPILVSGVAFATLPPTENAVAPANTLAYSGVLVDAGGAPVTGAHDVLVVFFKDAAGTMQLCPVPKRLAVPFEGGRFRADVSDCATLLASVTTAYIKVTVSVGANDVAIPSTGDLPQISAVPYAISSSFADKATTATIASTVPANYLTHDHTLTVAITSVNANLPANIGTEICSAGCSAGTTLTGGGCYSTGCGTGFGFPCPGINIEGSLASATSTAWCCYFDNTTGQAHTGFAYQQCADIGSKTLP